MTLFKYQREQCVVMNPFDLEKFLIRNLVKSRDGLGFGDSDYDALLDYFLNPVEALEYMRESPPQIDKDPLLEGVYKPGTLLYFDSKENSVWYGDDNLGYILLIRDKQHPLIWEVESYKERVTRDLTTTGIKITKTEETGDWIGDWEHESHYIYHKFYTINHDSPVQMQLLNWVGGSWKTLLHFPLQTLQLKRLLEEPS